MALIITSNDITYRNLVGVAPSVYVVVNPNFEYTKHDDVSKIRCTIDVYKDKATYEDQDLKESMKLDINHISPKLNLSYTSKTTLEQEINEDLKAILIDRVPSWSGKIQIVDLGYQNI